MVELLKKDQKELWQGNPMQPKENVKKSFRMVLRYGLRSCKSKAGKHDYCHCVQHSIGGLMKDIMKQHCHLSAIADIQSEDLENEDLGTSESINLPNIVTNIRPWMTMFAFRMKAGNVDVDATKIASGATTRCTGGSSWKYGIEKRYYERCAMKSLD